MTSADRKEASPAFSQEAAEEMVKYGITRVPVDYFHYGNFRYTNLEDAVAEAKRQQPPNESRPAISPEGTEEIAKYGITRVPVDYFHYGKYRYTNLEDAVAEAKREQRPS
jgi:kynurenine formamidase